MRNRAFKTDVTKTALELLGLILAELDPEEFSREEIMAEFATYTKGTKGLMESELDRSLDFLLLGQFIKANEERDGFFSITEAGVALETFSAASDEVGEESD